MNDIFEMIKDVYGKYNIDGLHNTKKYWILCASVQIAEMQLALEQGDNEHFLKEMADLALVAIDALNKLGYDSLSIIEKRLIENSTKNFTQRDMKFYEKKWNDTLEKILSLREEKERKCV